MPRTGNSGILKVHFCIWQSFTVLQKGRKMKTILIKMIRLYQKYLSPLKRTRCPYIPTCSQYGLEAIQKYGAVKGSMLACWRILRCNPFSHGGYDPVP
ncbi:membrane protein insertion efficiency factor YidD [Lactonifactor sp. BIOML-A3]|nr:membrane protein insertion efficiency factor YidD [Lactonifactor sp. BIOML-A5]MSA10377.1 membrane protein insertion efficiency factor YidD [Lactonifactor sp. BIOML-A4]MSA14833.1 membrane protein insertion efficiency factor YidD [Lactonifactor sp. BIOML-A3]MSA19349.1 membrane protein insertion efficiency factor YidD [Lactonifactor sp. BIOML-A2]MSA39929.1 membrane protein insertion efficiency factor YidD [Lactonifactor sp. BIOML-A1]MSB15757.1 membrane protein insertion efficiency factor YidD 